MSHTTASAPTSARSWTWSGFRTRPRARWPPSASSRSNLSPIWPCPPATSTSMTWMLRPRRPAAWAGYPERLEQVEPHLAPRRERGHGVEEAVERDLAHHGDRRGLEELGHLGPGEGGADDDVAVVVDHQPRRASRVVAAVEARAGIALGGHVDRAHVQPVLLGGVERVSDGRHVRVGEDHARGARAVGVRGDAAARIAEYHVRRDARLVLAHVGEERAAVHVADRVQPVVVGAPHRIVHLDRLAGLEADT